MPGSENHPTSEKAACHYITCTARYRNRIFLNNEDYQAFLKMTDAALLRYDVEMLHYCILPNEAHFFLRARDSRAAVEDMIQELLTEYSAWFKSRSAKKGRVFERTFKTIGELTDKEAFFYGRRIENMPVALGLIPSTGFYPYRSRVTLVQSTQEA